MKKYLIGAIVGAVGYHFYNKLLADKVSGYVALGKMWISSKLEELKNSTSEEAAGE